MGGTPVPISGLNTVFENIVGVLIPLAGIVFFIIAILGGFKYLTAGDNPQKMQAAQNTITWGIGGIVFIAMAYLILVLIEEFTGAPVTVFNVVFP